MSYPIIFETKIVKLPDSRIIHFECNGYNDDEKGGKSNDFNGKIYTESGFIERVNTFKQGLKPYAANGLENWNLQIGNRYVTCRDYGDYLLQKLKRAISYEDFIKQYCLSARYCKGIEILRGEQRKVVTVEEFAELYCNPDRKEAVIWRNLMEYPKELNTVIDCLEQGKDMLFYITERERNN